MKIITLANRWHSWLVCVAVVTFLASAGGADYLTSTNGGPNKLARATPPSARNRSNQHSPPHNAALAAQRSTGRATLEADRAKAKGASPPQTRTITAKDLKNAAPHKLELAPLQPPQAPPPANSERGKRIEELQQELAKETDPERRDRTLLVLAAYYVGQNDWQTAKSILDDLVAISQDSGIQEAVRRNLEVVNLKLMGLSETNTVRQEQLELDLARLHADLGHEQAAKRIHRQLATTAADPIVRDTAGRLLKEPPKPTRLPPAPPNLNGQPETPPADPGKKGGAR